MEADKENVNRLKSKTRIPLPLRPLPALPTHLLQKKFEDNCTSDQVRFPLRTINSSSLLGGASKKRESVTAPKTKHPLKVDTRFVTLRNRNEDLDWDYRVFKDDASRDRDSSVISISDDDDAVHDHDKKQSQYFIEQKQRNCLGDARKVVTPVPKPSPLEPNRVRNIKRSLKRPHSRELQGLSPVAKREKTGEEKYKRRLDFCERSDSLQSPEHFKKCRTTCIETCYAVDLFVYMLSIERHRPAPKIPSTTRACVLNWLMGVNGPNGNPAVVQTAAWYLDSVLSVSSVQLEHLQTVAAACYWIAQKLHGPVATASRLVKFSNRAFTSKQLMGAEMAILNKLKFPSQPVIPQDYITYLSWCSDHASRREVEVAATFLCMCGMIVNKSLCSELPSVVAAACVKNAHLLLNKPTAQLQMSPIYQAAEKKAINMCAVCSALRRAVCLVASPTYEYKTPLEHFGLGPNFIAQKVVAVIAAKYTGMDY